MSTLEQAPEILKAVGLVAGGLWAAWTFQKLQKARAAELENNRRLTEIQKSHMEQEESRTRMLRQQPQLAIQLDVAETASQLQSCKSVLCITVSLKNEGDQNLMVVFNNSTLTIRRIVLGKDGNLTMGALTRCAPFFYVPGSDEPQMLPERVFRIGQQRKMVLAIVPVIEPEGYFIQFHAVYHRIPFDGEKPSGEEPTPINAIEQTFYLATGKAEGAASIDG
jgi:hypothetical protein